MALLRSSSVVFCFLLLSLSAKAADLPGESCSQLGVTMMSANQRELIACLRNDAGNLEWKSMTPKASVPVGTIIAWPLEVNPTNTLNADGTYNWLDCNGQGISSTAYPELAALFGAALPDLRGVFLRGQGGASAPLGQIQGDAMRRLYGEFTPAGNAWLIQPSGIFDAYYNGSDERGGNSVGGRVIFDSARTMPTANEIRPINVAVRFLVRAKP